jgi:ethanolamine ammonia-lyase large subunit
VYHPESGEKLSAEAVRQLTELANKRRGKEPDAQIVISDGLNANAIMDTGHLAPYLDELRKELSQLHFTVADELVVITSGRVRAGYRCGETLFGRIADTDAPKAIIHIIGERPGTIHHNFSIYFSAPPVKTWQQKGKVDHNITKVVSGVSDTSLHPVDAAKETAAILSKMMAKGRTQ